MPTNPTNNQPKNLVGAAVGLDLGFLMPPAAKAVIDADVDDNENFTIGTATDYQHSVWVLIVDEGAAVALAFVDNDGDAVVALEVGTATSKFSTTIGATNAQYQFGISSGNLVFQNTDGANKRVKIIRLA